MEFEAFYFDGKTSAKKEVQVHFYPIGELHIRVLEQELVYKLSEVRISPRLANIPRALYFPDGAKCETDDNDTVDAVLRKQKRGRWDALQYKVESRFKYILLSLILSVLIIWGFIQFGIPELSKEAAFALPASVQAKLGSDGLKHMDRLFLSPSELDAGTQNRLRSLFDRIKRDVSDEYDFRLEFRKAKKLGPNAFALPSGIIVVTDSMVRLAKHDNELAGVFAHEMGHVVYRHALRRLIQDSAVVVIIAGVTGDISSISSLSAALPTILVEAKYSRAFEREADRFAMKYMKEHNIPPGYLADILIRIEKKEKANSSFDYLSTHPATQKRVKVLREE